MLVLPILLVKEGCLFVEQQQQQCCHHQQVVVHPNQHHKLKRGPEKKSYWTSYLVW